jgi:hypothetical protein
VTVLTTKKLVGFDGTLDGSYLLKEYSQDQVRFIEVPYGQSKGYLGADKSTKPTRVKRVDRLAAVLRGFSPFFIDRRASWFFRAASNLDRLLEGIKIDVVVSSFPLSYCHILAFLVARKYRVPWLADYRDPWSCDKLRRAPWPFYLFDYLIEKILIAGALRITAVSTGQAKLIGGWLGREVDVIYNGSDDHDFATINEFELIPSRKAVLLRYIGTVQDGKLYPYKEFLEAFAHFARSSVARSMDIKVEFIGPGSETLAELVQVLEIEPYVALKPSVSMLEAKRLMRDSSILIFFDVRSSFEIPGVLSGKIFEYLAARRPIISVGDDRQSDVNKLIENCKVGLFFNAGEKYADFGAILHEITALSSVVKPDYSQVSQFRRSVQADQALSILHEMIGSRGQA